ncbi:MAG: hypothetical protein ACJAYU_001513 [Bradymonadia bacterium]
MNDRLLAAAAAFAAVFVASLWGAWPGLSALDGGDFITASAVFGVPHATGFPLQVQLGSASTLLPLGNIAWRCALVSVFCSAAAAGLFTWLGASLGRLGRGSVVVAIAIAIAFVRVDTLVLHARVTEVYALNLMLVGVALVCLERLESTGDLRWRSVLALVCGLGLANHALFRLWLVPLFICSVVFVPQRVRWKGLGGCVVLGVAAVAAYGYLVVAASAAPPHNWGDPSTLERWWAHVSARDIRNAFEGEMLAGGYPLAVYTRTLLAQTWAGLGLLAPAGVLAWWWWGRWRLGLVVVILTGLDAAYSVAINPMGLRDFQNGQLLMTVVAMSAGVSMGSLSELRPRSWTIAAAAVVTLGLAAAGVGHHFGGSGRDWSMEDLVVAQFGDATPEALIAPASDSLTAGLLYGSAGLGIRPDVFCLGRYALSDDRAAVRAIDQSPYLVLSPEVRTSWMEAGTYGQTSYRAMDVLEANFGVRDIYWEATGNSSELPGGLRLSHRWPLGLVIAADSTEGECEPASRSWCDGLDPSFAHAARFRSGANGYFYGRWAARQWAFIGSRHFRANDFAEAGIAFQNAIALNGEAGPWYTNLALSLASMGRLTEAQEIQEIAIDFDPLSLRAHETALRLSEALGDEARAIEAERVLELLGATSSPDEPNPELESRHER